jgi:hypothetical protein
MGGRSCIDESREVKSRAKSHRDQLIRKWGAAMIDTFANHKLDKGPSISGEVEVTVDHTTNVY